MRAVGNHDKAERYYLRALTAAEKIAPYKYARLSAVKVMGDPNAQKDFEDGATLEELKAMVEYHLERVAPFLDLEVILESRSSDIRQGCGARTTTQSAPSLRVGRAPYGALAQQCCQRSSDKPAGATSPNRRELRRWQPHIRGGRKVLASIDE